ncbi:MAG: hypothetical protein JNJ53_10175 [Rhizobiales bacterium]|nr:hypothetical protein [Hyphomicrobiales bacterium]
MTATTGLADEYSFAAEGMAGTAAGVALRRVSSLARFAPTRQAVDAIASLTELGGRIEAALVAADRTLADGKRDEAVSRLDEAMDLMDKLARLALVEPEVAPPDRMLRGSLG